MTGSVTSDTAKAGGGGAVGGKAGGSSTGSNNGSGGGASFSSAGGNSNNGSSGLAGVNALGLGVVVCLDGIARTVGYPDSVLSPARIFTCGGSDGRQGTVTADAGPGAGSGGLCNSVGQAGGRGGFMAGSGGNALAAATGNAVSGFAGAGTGGACGCGTTGPATAQSAQAGQGFVFIERIG